MSPNPLRSIPSVNELLENPQLKGLVDRLSHNVVVSTARTVLDEVRSEVQTAASERTMPSVSDLAERIARRIAEGKAVSLRPVINATGNPLDDRFGRAPLAEEAIEAVADVAGNYSTVQFDPASGRRSSRAAVVEELLAELTGAEAALVLGDEAGALMLALAATASAREVIVARGQLFEIDEDFRLPQIVATAGAVLREVGTANRTREEDYAEAIGESSGALMRIDPTGARLADSPVGVPVAALATLARRHKLPVIHYLGAGALRDLEPFGFAGEPVVGESVKAGADLVLLPGNELLGGPQCGIVVGARAAIGKLEKHALARALRADRLTLAALAATLRLWRDPEEAELKIPLLRLLGTSVENLQNRAERLAGQIAAAKGIAEAEATAGVTRVGAGALPAGEVPTWCIAVKPDGRSPEQLQAALQQGSPAVFGRVEGDRLLLDLRSVMPRQDVQLVEAFDAPADEEAS